MGFLFRSARKRNAGMHFPEFRSTQSNIAVEEWNRDSRCIDVLRMNVSCGLAVPLLLPHRNEAQGQHSPIGPTGFHDPRVVIFIKRCVMIIRRCFLMAERSMNGEISRRGSVARISSFLHFYSRYRCRVNPPLPDGGISPRG